ncbi:DNRLRE domain-containing protein [Mucilaginibacter sp. JRF]|uniref:CBM96 family carbohydrate-binding protein n=1 Tax=Mucilaginibacter sp. JRF TaxID=2780088 RepID=UPI0018817860|nr:DNRLRE domain-containing protein [Mucilaginibacter sp. JRF]MBE9586949.1 DNRLRE domain-containing protein [Mucilaginibacter sp. JRF]
MNKTILIVMLISGMFSVASCSKEQQQNLPTEQSAVYAPINVNSSLDEFSLLTWGTAKAQPIATHEIQGELVNGKLYIFGGFDVNKRPQWTPTKRAYVYDPIADTWASIKSMPHEPFGSNFGGGTHVATATDETDIYLAGGYTSNANGTGQIFGTKQVWKYSVATNNYTRMPDLPLELAAGQLRYLNGKLHYIGGAKLSRTDTKMHLALDLNNPGAGWVTLASLNNAVNHPGGVVYNGKIYIMGGSHGQNEASVPQKTLQVYDEQTDSWTNLADMPVALDHILSTAVVYGNRIIVLGGQTAHNTPGKQVLAYEPETNKWTILSPMRAAKSAGVAAVINGNIYYTGGNFSAINYKGVPVINTPATELLPMADAFVRNGSFGSVNYGSDTLLIIKGSTVSNYYRSAYLKFSLADISRINSATLSVYARNTDNTSSLTLSAFGIDDDSWTENGLTFANAPQATSSALSIASVNNQFNRIDFDVTAFVQSQFAGDKLVSFALRDAANKNLTVQLNSKENSRYNAVLTIH